MDLTSISNLELLNRVERLARGERKITHLILWHLVEVEFRRLYLDLGFTSLFKYMTGHLQYSEDAAYRRIQASRLLKKVPKIENAIESGDLKLTQLNQVQKCISKAMAGGAVVSAEQTESVLEQIQNKNSFETQKVLAVEFNQPILEREILKPQRNDSVRMEITFSEDQMNELKQVRELLSHVLPNPTWAELISYLANFQIQKKLGKQIVGNEMVRKASKNAELAGEAARDEAEEAEGVTVMNKNELDKLNMNESRRIQDGVEINANSSASLGERKHLKLTLRRRLLRNANYQCEFNCVGGKCCTSKYQLQIDHRLPLALGGSNDESNLRVLCRTHNLAEARRMGITKH
ncbi:HNH endonuclease [Bdellovibrio sp. HCB290]|uniref:HNH endonuclease n=1 Tax=Bdellovibrio sp. HCB290 TaxID=3394356 RepID=UPI0039B54623